MRRQSVPHLLHKFWGSFSSSCLVTWAAQVAGGDEPPSVLSDNLPKVWLIAPDLFASAARALGLSKPCQPHPLSRPADGHQGYKLISQSVALWEGSLYGGFRPVSVSLSKRTGADAKGEELSGIRCVAGIACPFAELRWTAPLPGLSRAKAEVGTIGFLSRQD